MREQRTAQIASEIFSWEGHILISDSSSVSLEWENSSAIARIATLLSERPLTKWPKPVGKGLFLKHIGLMPYIGFCSMWWGRPDLIYARFSNLGFSVWTSSVFRFTQWIRFAGV